MSSGITPTTRGSSWRRSTRRSPTGSCAAASSDCNNRGISHMSDYVVLNPATEQAVRTVPGTTADQADAAIARAEAAQRSWRAVTPGDRARLLRAFAAQVDAHVEELAQLEVANSGHPV